MTRPGLTPRELDLLEYLRDFIPRETQPPTFDQMAAALGTSKGFAHKLSVGLETKGYLTRLKGHARSLALVEESERFSPGAEAKIAAYCRRRRVLRTAAIAHAVESIFGGAA